MKQKNYKGGDIVVLLYQGCRIVGNLVDIDNNLYFRPNGMRVCDQEILESVSECIILNATKKEKEIFLNELKK